MVFKRSLLTLSVLLCTITLLSACGAGTSADISEATTLMASDEAEQRLKGIQMLRGDTSIEAITALVDALHDPDSRVQHKAILYLDEAGLPGVSELAGRYMDEINVPILQKDLDTPAYINPLNTQNIDLETDRAVLVFFPEIIEGLATDPRARRVTTFEGEDGDNPLYVVDVNGVEVMVKHPGVGSPLAALRFEALIAAGAKRIIAVGGAGVLDGSVKFGDVVVIEEAIRDEGTSYHYLPPRKRVYPNTVLRDHLKQLLANKEVDHLISKTWTTDAFYRETEGIVEQRKLQGCVVVEMEASMFFAVAAHRGVHVAQMVYGADDLSGEEWDERDWRNVPELRKQLFEIALEAAATAPEID